MVVHLLEPYAIREPLFKRKKSAFPAVDDMERTLHEEVMNVCATCRALLLMLGLDFLRVAPVARVNSLLAKTALHVCHSICGVRVFSPEDP